jgi:hypothetical protein
MAKSWKARLRAALKSGRFSGRDKVEARINWLTCAVGEVSPKRAKYLDKVGVDNTRLQEAGSRFGERVWDGEVRAAIEAYADVVREAVIEEITKGVK